MDIDRPIDGVFAFVADAERMDQWIVGVSDVRRLSEEAGVGARYESQYTYGPGTHRMTYEVTAYDPPTRYGIRSVEGPFPFEGVLTLEPTATGTRVTNALDTAPDGRATAAMFTVLRP